MMTKNKKGKITTQSAIIILIIIFDLAFLYFNKYRNQNLNLSDFNLLNFGNLANLFFTILLVIGLLIVNFKTSIAFNSKMFNSIFFINQILLVTLYFLNHLPLPFTEIYFLGQTGDQLFSGAIFAFYTITCFIMIFLVWLSIFDFKSILFLRASLNSVLTLISILLLVFVFIIGKEAVLKEDLITNDTRNVGVVLGAAVWSENKPSPSLANRVDKALSLYEQNKISQIYLTGSNAPGELSESEVALKYIKSKGIKTSDIFLEKETSSTNEQIQYIKKNLLLSSNKNVIVISDSYHLVRVLEIAKFHNMKIQVSASELSQSFEKAVYNKFRESLALTMFWLYAL
jgi:vancomycin permeability regulator SanA